MRLEIGFFFRVPGLNLWVIGGLLGRLHLGGVVRRCKGIGWISAPVGTTNCASSTRLAVKPCALRRTAARLQGLDREPRGRAVCMGAVNGSLGSS